MKLPKYAIEYHQFTLVMIGLLVLAGIVSLITMPRSEDPQVSPPASSVIVIYPGASPSDIEQLIVDPIEEALNGLEDIKSLTSTSSDNIGIVAIEFDGSCDPDEKYAEVVQEVNSIRSDLPENILSLDVRKWSVSNVAIFQIALLSDSAAFPLMESEAKRLKKSLEKVNGVREVNLHAIPEQEIRVSIDLGKLAMYEIPLTHVMGALQDANANIPGGHVNMDTKSLSVKTSGSYRSVKEIQNTVIHSVRGKPVFVQDVAEVGFDLEDNTYLARVDGKRAIFITVTQKSNTNIFWISSRIKELLDEFRDGLPRSIQQAIVFDQSESVSHRVTGFFINLLQGLVLVGLVIFLAVGTEASIIVMMAIPISILIGIGFVDLSGFGLEQMSITGMVIALGLLVDNAIVVTENVTRFMKMGYGRVESAVLGTSQVGWAVSSATITTVLAFIPIMMMPDETGDFIRSMPTMVVFTLTASLLISLTLTPYLSEKFLKTTNGHRERPLRHGLNYLIETVYLRVLRFGLTRPILLLLITLCVFLASLGLFPLIGVSMFPKAEKPIFYINVNCPEDTNIEQTDRIVQKVEKELIGLAGVKHVISNIGYGNPSLYYNMAPERNKASYGQIVVTLKKYKSRQYAKTVGTLRNKFRNYPDARIEVKELEQGPPMEAPVAIKVLGDNLAVLKELANEVEHIIQSEEGTLNVRNPMNNSKMDLKLQVNRDKAGIFGVPLSEIDRTIRAAITGIPVTKYRDEEGEEYDIVVRLPLEGKPTLSDFDRIYVTSLAGAQIPLKQFVTVKLTNSPLEIQHHNLDRSVLVTADVQRGYSIAKITQNVMDKLNQFPNQKGTSFYIGGEQENREESFGGMGKAVIIALIAIFGVLVFQFRSYTQPLIVFSAIPLAIIGSLLALFLTGNSFSFTAFIGLTSLVGIVVNNSIILVDYTNQLRREGKETVSALKEAGETRFIPIILTTLTTIGGLLPLTLSGGTMWAPMGWTIIGGLLVSTFLTLVIVPVLYKLFTPTMAEEME